MRKTHECHSEPLRRDSGQAPAKNLAFSATYEGEILRLSPQDDIRHSLDAGEGASACSRANADGLNGLNSWNGLNVGSNSCNGLNN